MTTKMLAIKLHPLCQNIVCTFLATLQPLALSWVNGSHLFGPSGWPADAGAVDGADAEVVAASNFEVMDWIFTHLYWGIVALDPGVSACLAPVVPDHGIIISAVISTEREKERERR